jgi:DNA-binding NarL/FixJ family response regulator
VLRRLAPPTVQHEVVVAVDEHPAHPTDGVWQAPHFVTRDTVRILICEDDEQLAALITELLETDGDYTVVGHARDGDDAVRLSAELGPQLVLMDIGLPGRDGISATRAIRARDGAPHVVIYTGSDEYGDIERAGEAGAAGYLHKSALTSPDLPEALRVLHRNYLAAHPD